MKAVYIILMIITLSCLNAELNWQHIYFSGVGADGMRAVRIQATESDPNILLKENNIITQTPMPALDDGYNNYQVTVREPAYPFIGFRQQTDSTTVILPVWYDYSTVPALSDLTHAMTDPAGDALFTQTNLDIVNSYAVFSNDKFYFAIINNGGGFPVSSGFTFYSYMAAIVNPATANEPNPTVWGLMFTVDVAGIIAPGLYRITGTSTSDMTLLGQIQTHVIAGSNCLLLSCNKADLLADSSFSAWFSEDNPVIGCQIITNKISLVSGTLLADQTNGFDLIHKKVVFAPETVPYQVISNPTVTYLANWNLAFGVDYFSEDSFFPIEAEVVIDNEHTFTLIPTEFPDFNHNVHYSAIVNPIETGEWTQAVYRFTCNGINWSTTQITNTANNDYTEILPPGILITNHYPNPIGNYLNLEFSKDAAIADLCIYNLKGQRILDKQIKISHNKYMLDLSGVDAPNGIYFLKITAQNLSQIKKVLIRRKDL